MRTLPSLLLLCGGYGGTAIEYGSLTGQYGLDYCIAEAELAAYVSPVCTADRCMVAESPSTIDA